MRNSDDTPSPHFRAGSRFHQENGAWFYSTREGQHGPFESKEAAEADARRYAGLHSHLEQIRDRSRDQSAE